MLELNEKFLTRHLWVFFILPVFLGLVWPLIGIWLFAPYVVPLLFLVMVFSLLEVPVRESLKSGMNWQGLNVLFIQYVLFGILGFFAAHFFPPELFIGFIIVSVIPSGVSAPSMVDVFGGSTAKAISITSANYAVAPVLVPLLTLILAGQRVPVDVFKLLQSLLLFIALPLMLVYLLRRMRLTKTVAPFRKWATLGLIGLIVWGETAQSASFFYQNPLTCLAVLVAFLLISFAVFLIAIRLTPNRKDQIAYGTLSYFKNNALSITLLSTLFSPAAAAVAVIDIVAIHVFLAVQAKYFK